MDKLQPTSTFSDFQNLLKNNDNILKQQLTYLNSEKFSKTATDKGYLKRNLHFFMAIILQGVQSDKKRQDIINFLHILYPQKDQTTYETDTTWRRNAGNFVNGKGNIDKDLNDKLKEIDAQTQIISLINGDWYDLKDSKGNPIFYSIDNENNKKICKFTAGEQETKNKINQVAQFLVYGTQVTSTGGFFVMTDPYTLLKANKQLIMNGAPGTGKTYSARNEIADNLLGLDGKTDDEKKEVKEIRMDMVQFHPSYDYTDFIEGIRPVMTTNTSASGIGYTLKNGSFKKFCRRAGVIERLIAADRLINDQSIDDFLNGEDDEIKDFWKDWIKGSGISLINTLNNTITNPHKNEKTEDSKIERPNDGSEHNEKTEESIELPSFLFIIDEINRAEISKVLGETMYCLDPDYRGPKGRIATQYSAIATKESFFVDETNDKFFIPSNVYIIGTMNDIDRSVEVFDFALRRRFAWHEVKAEDVMDTVLKSMKVDQLLDSMQHGQYADYLSRIESLNTAIDNKLKLNRHYHLGPSYFAKISLYLDSSGSNYIDARKDVWNNHISQILYEYVKGKRTENNVEEIGNTFKN